MKRAALSSRQYRGCTSARQHGFKAVGVFDIAPWFGAKDQPDANAPGCCRPIHRGIGPVIHTRPGDTLMAAKKKTAKKAAKKTAKKAAKKTKKR